MVILVFSKYLGNVITNLPPNTKLGPGLARNIVTDKIITSESGILKLQNGYAFIEGAKKRYIPSKGTTNKIFVPGEYYWIGIPSLNSVRHLLWYLYWHL